jgi:ABC-type lipoprotein release transport system permease subunit
LFSKNSNNAINIISSIATLGVIGGSLALLLVLSAVNF